MIEVIANILRETGYEVDLQEDYMDVKKQSHTSSIEILNTLENLGLDDAIILDDPKEEIQSYIRIFERP